MTFQSGRVVKQAPLSIKFLGNFSFRGTSRAKLHFAQRFGTKREQMQRLKSIYWRNVLFLNI